MKWIYLFILLSNALQAAYIKRPLPLFAEQGTPLQEDRFPAAYNAAARADIEKGWDFFLTGSFLYWYAEQEGMELAIPLSGQIVIPSTDPSIPTFSLSPSNGVSILRSDFDYHAGFKVGIGVGFDGDNWLGALEYTYMHQSVGTPTHTEGSVVTSTLPGATTITADFFGLTSWFTGLNGLLPFFPATTVRSKWKMDLDMGDAYLSRPFYQGRYITISPFAGIRGAMIRQSFRVWVTIPELSTLIGSADLTSRNYSHSWAVGPRLGIKGHWLLGGGFRLEGDAAGSLLFTRYTKVSHAETPMTALSSPHFRFHDYNTTRPIGELGLGIGWGSYVGFCRNPSGYLDLSANYDLLVFWGQNMMEKLVSDYTSFASHPSGDLHMHGVTGTLSLDF